MTKPRARSRERVPALLCASVLVLAACGDERSAGSPDVAEQRACGLLRVESTLPVPPPGTSTPPLTLAEAIRRSVAGSFTGERAEAQVVLTLGSASALNTIAEEVATIDGVDDVQPVTQEEALAEFIETLGSTSSMAEDLTPDQVPARLDVQVQGDEALAGLRQALAGDSRVQEVLDDRLQPSQVSTLVTLLAGVFSSELEQLASDGPSGLHAFIDTIRNAADPSAQELGSAELPALVEAARSVNEFVAERCEP